MKIYYWFEKLGSSRNRAENDSLQLYSKEMTFGSSYQEVRKIEGFEKSEFHPI